MAEENGPVERELEPKPVPGGYDGRFGARFDDEIATRKVVLATAAIGAVCALTFVLVWLLIEALAAGAEVRTPGTSAAVEDAAGPAFPEPRLQTDPEAELEVLRRREAGRLSSYGWVDEAEGTVHIPIEKAMELLIERGHSRPRPAAPSAAAPAGVGSEGPAAAGGGEE